MTAPPAIEESKRRILEAAEWLFAERTVNCVSLREIALRAGHGNNNAVQYHFGSKENLVQAIFRWRIMSMEPQRARALAVIEAEGRADDLRSLLEALCFPLLDLVDKQGRFGYAAFVTQYMLHERPGGHHHIVDAANEVSVSLRRLLDHFYRILNAPKDFYTDYGISLAYLMFANMLLISQAEGIVRSDPELFQQRIRVTLDMGVAALQAAVRSTGYTDLRELNGLKGA